MAILKQRLRQKNTSGTYDTIYLEVDLSNVVGVLAPEHGGMGGSGVTEVESVEITPQSIGAASLTTFFLTSNTQPASSAQVAGEFWCEPVSV